MRFLVLAPTATPINGAATLTAGFKNFFQAVWVPLKIFYNLFLNPAPSNRNCLGVKLIRFCHLHLGFEQISCNLKVYLFAFKSHHAEFDIGEQCIFLHLADF